MIPEAIRQDILSRLRSAEEEHGVRVLFAIESGSRAWGFASPNSDYDARFIYVHPKDWYLSIGLEEQRDVIEYPIIDEIDINGWDLRKALRLFWKSNPGYVEWIQSPIVYVSRGDLLNESRQRLPEIYSCTNGFYHYYSMASKTFKAHLQTDQVSLKKYFYVLRPLLAARWVARKQEAAPIEFQRLMSVLDDAPEVVSAIEELLVIKQASPESGRSTPIPVIQNFIQDELDKLESIKPHAPERTGNVLTKLDALFTQTLEAAWA